MASPLAFARRSGALARIVTAAARVRMSGDEASRRGLAAALVEARGIPLKVGQFLADRTDAYEAAVNDVPPLPLDTMRPILAPLEDHLVSVEPAIGAASLGQVHPARLRDGREVVIKVQYPGIGDAVDAELSMLAALPAMGPARRAGMDVDGYRRVLGAALGAELDYTLEADAQLRAQDLGVPGVYVPTVVRELCRPNLLVTERVWGVPTPLASSWVQEDRATLARAIGMAWMKMVLVTGEVHADANAGNLLVRRTAAGPEVVLLDWGSVAQVSEERRLALLRMALAARGEIVDDPLSVLCAFGFDASRLAPLAGVLGAVVRIVGEAMTQPCHSGSVDMGARLAAILGDARWWFRASGPPDLFLLVRMLHGVGARLADLDVRIEPGAWLDAVVPAELVARARSAAVLPATPPSVAATWIKVEVVRDGVTTARVALPAERAFALEELLPEAARVGAEQRGVDVSAVTAELRRDGLTPRELFQAVDGAARWRVWLE
jgi:hypothetical protein